MAVAENEMAVGEFEAKLLEVARECAAKGPGYAQQGVVLREMHDRLQTAPLEQQQRILDAWHRLFTDGKLVWGYDLDNPGPPFFHVPNRG